MYDAIKEGDLRPFNASPSIKLFLYSHVHIANLFLSISLTTIQTLDFRNNSSLQNFYKSLPSSTHTDISGCPEIK